MTFTTAWMKWARYNKKLLPIAAAIEVKITTGPNLFFSQIPKHQRDALELAKWGAYCYKLSDASRVKMPNDVIWMRDAAGLFVFHWVKKGNKMFYLVDIDAFLNFEECSKKKSMTEVDAAKIAMITGKLK